MDEDYLPQQDAEWDAWLANFVAALAARGQGLGFTAEEIARISNAGMRWRGDYAAHLRAQEAARAASAAKDAARAEATRLVTEVVRRLESAPELTDDIREAFRLTTPQRARSLIEGVTETPLLLLDSGDPGRIRVHFGPNPSNERDNELPVGAVGVLIQCHEGGVPDEPNQWTWLANCLHSPYAHVVEGATPRTFAYRCAYVTRKLQQGLWSVPAVGTVTPREPGVVYAPRREERDDKEEDEGEMSLRVLSAGSTSAEARRQAA